MSNLDYRQRGTAQPLAALRVTIPSQRWWSYQFPASYSGFFKETQFLVVENPGFHADLS